MKKDKVVIISVIIVLIILLIIFINLYLKIIKNDNNDKIVIENIAAPIDERNFIIEPTLQKLTIKSYSETVKVCINEFFKYYSGIYNPESFNALINYNTEDEIERVRSNNIEAIYNILDENYISFSNITIDNLQTRLAPIPKVEVTIDDDIYVSQKNENISLFFVTGKLINQSNSKTSNFNIMLCIDMKNRNYSVFLSDYIKKYYPDINVGQTISFDNIPNEIVNKKYNAFEFQIGK